MKLADIARRIDRAEQSRAPRDPAAMPRAAVLYLTPGEDAAPYIDRLIKRGEHRRGWPVLTIRANWLLTHRSGSIAPCA